MKKRIEHTFCDLCGEQIPNGSTCFNFEGKEYCTYICAYDAVEEHVVNKAEISVVGTWSPLAPTAVAVFSTPLTVGLKSFTEACARGETMQNMIYNMLAILGLDRKEDPEMTGEAITKIVESNPYFLITIPAIKKVKYGTAPTLQMDASIDCWLKFGLKGEHEAVWFADIYGRDYSSFGKKPLVNQPFEMDLLTTIDVIVSEHIVPILVGDMGTYSTVEDQDVDNVQIDMNTGKMTQTEVNGPLNPGRAIMEDQTEDLFNL